MPLCHSHIHLDALPRTRSDAKRTEKLVLFSNTFLYLVISLECPGDVAMKRYLLLARKGDRKVALFEHRTERFESAVSSPHFEVLLLTISYS